MKKVKSMTRAEAIKILKRTREDTGDLLYEAFDMAIKALEEPQWIPCSEKNPPEEAKRYWICTDGGYQCQCRWTNVNYFWDGLTTDWKWHFMDIPQYSEVIAWMPLPEPWKGDAE
jgi:hypothetical protein